MKHRTLSMLLALLMVVSLLPIAAVADTTEENADTKEPIKKEDTVEWNLMTAPKCYVKKMTRPITSALAI